MKIIKFAVLIVLFLATSCFNKKSISGNRVPSSELAGSSASDAPGGSLDSNILPGLPNINREFSSRCLSIITAQGKPGPVGRKLLKAMKDVDKDKGLDCFFGSDEKNIPIGKYCKGQEHFNSLSKSEKEHLWLWFWASLAQVETSCDPKATYRERDAVVNGRVLKRGVVFQGMFLLPSSSDSKARDKENSIFCPEDTDTLSDDFQVRCSVSRLADRRCGGDLFGPETPDPAMIKNTLEGRTNTWRPLFQEKSRLSRQLKSLIKSHPLCN